MQEMHRTIRQPCTAAHPLSSTGLSEAKQLQATLPAGSQEMPFTQVGDIGSPMQQHQAQRAEQTRSESKSNPCMQHQRPSSLEASYPILRLWWPLQEP